METTTVRDDRGSALIMTLMVMALLTALSTTVSVLTIDNLRSSWRAQQAGSALNAADAGVAQAITYLRNTNVRKLSCSPTCAANAWGNRAAPAAATLAGRAGEAYRTWIEAVRPYPAANPGRYRIHSTGTAAGTASRAVIVDVDVSTTDLPTGVFARTVNGGGDASIARESIFSTGCVYNRSKIEMVPGQLDINYGIPIGVHSSQYITDSNGTGQYCPLSDHKLIHTELGGAQSGHPGCHPTYPYDHDRLGGDLTGSTCAATQTTYPTYFGQRDLDGDGTLEVNGSYVKDDATLFSLFRIKTPALSQDQVDELRTAAQEQGNYWTSATGWSSPDEPDAVMYFDLTAHPGGTVDLNDLTGFSRAADMADTSASCPQKSLAIVVEGGNVKLNSNQQLFASLYLTSGAPYGQVFKANGTSQFIGTIYADTVNLTGTADISLDSCFLANISPGLRRLEVVSYREDDRGLD